MKDLFPDTLPKIYRVRNWSTHFENNRTRDMVKMAWIPVPNNHDGDGYTTLVSRENGAAFLGAWIAILQVASKCETRGTLLRAGNIPHTAASIARITRLNESIITQTIEILLSECKWLELIHSHDGAGNPQATDEEGKGREGNGMERKGREGNAAQVVEFWNRMPFQKCVSLSADRKKHLSARLKEDCFFDNWELALKRIEKSDFCLGKNDREWIATIDWFLRPGTVAKILEGNYDNRKNNVPKNKMTVTEINARIRDLVSEFTTCTENLQRRKEIREEKDALEVMLKQ